jgi:hypothetical protein
MLGNAEAELFGKRVLFTDHDDRPTADIVAYYRSQSEAESSTSTSGSPAVSSCHRRARQHSCWTSSKH